MGGGGARKREGQEAVRRPGAVRSLIALTAIVLVLLLRVAKLHGAVVFDLIAGLVTACMHGRRAVAMHARMGVDPCSPLLLLHCAPG